MLPNPHTHAATVKPASSSDVTSKNHTICHLEEFINLLEMPLYILLLDIDDLCQEIILVSCGSSICTTSSSYKNETETATAEIGLHGTIVASHQLGTNQIETSVNEFSRSMGKKETTMQQTLV